MYVLGAGIKFVAAITQRSVTQTGVWLSSAVGMCTAKCVASSSLYCYQEVET